MSIQDEIKTHFEKELYLLESEFGGEETPRTIYYTTEVRQIIDGANSTGPDKSRFASAKAVMDAFIDLGEIAFGMAPFDKYPYAQMARTDPIDHGVVSFRVLDPKPGIRVFGCFAATDTFIALTWGFRDDMDYCDEVVRCRQEWVRLFPSSNPHQGANVNDYVSINATAV